MLKYFGCFRGIWARLICIITVICLRKSQIGYPKYKHGDVVIFSYDCGKGMIEVYGGKILIADSYGSIG